MAYEVAATDGLRESQVEWVGVPFNKSYAPGDKDFDFDINNISVTEQREQAVDFSDSYYDLTQALMVLKGSPIEHATTMADLKDAVFGAQIGTTSLDFINTVIRPHGTGKVFDIDGRCEGGAAERQGRRLGVGSAHGVLRGVHRATERRTVSSSGSSRARASTSGMLFEKGDPLVGCVNLALAEMTADGTSQQLQDKWLADYLARTRDPVGDPGCSMAEPPDALTEARPRVAAPREPAAPGVHGQHDRLLRCAS